SLPADLDERPPWPPASPAAEVAPPADPDGPLRVCADPNNLPFSDRRGTGFENRIVEVLAEELGTTVETTWWAQRRGFLRNTLRAGLCDVVPGLPSSTDMALVTAPYYRSAYVFVARPGTAAAAVRSFDDPALRRLLVGVQLIGDDYTNTPPAHALAARGVIGNVRGYPVYGDYREESPPAEIVRAVGRGEVDLAVVWGPLAGYWAARQEPPLPIVPVSPEIDLPFLPFVFDVAMGVRRGDEALRDRLDRAIAARRGEIDTILADYGVPRLDRPAAGGAG
ncbi:MAG TPA: substrate-binding domain-containing protein, partial [Thermoanaerobaculia bacterium]|nr:substrate-binding domain-containing protein [Thermoanaerobaculia bacterium]